MDDLPIPAPIRRVSTEHLFAIRVCFPIAALQVFRDTALQHTIERGSLEQFKACMVHLLAWPLVVQFDLTCILQQSLAYRPDKLVKFPTPQAFGRHFENLANIWLLVNILKISQTLSCW